MADFPDPTAELAQHVITAIRKYYEELQLHGIRRISRALFYILLHGAKLPHWGVDHILKAMIDNHNVATNEEMFNTLSRYVFLP